MTDETITPAGQGGRSIAEVLLVLAILAAVAAVVLVAVRSIGG